MNAKSLVAVVALVATAGAFAQTTVQAERDFYVFGSGTSAAPAGGKTRAEVLAELAEARRTGELERIRADYYGYEDMKPAHVLRLAKRGQ